MNVMNAMNVINVTDEISPTSSSRPEVANVQRRLLSKRQKELRDERARLDRLEKNVKLIAKKMGVELS